MTENQDSHWEKIAGKLHGELSAEEETEFNELIAENVHLKEFDKAQKIRDDMTAAGNISASGKVNSWRSVETGMRRDQMRLFITLMKYAAIIIVAFVAGNMIRTPAVPDQTLHFSEIHVPYGQMSQLTLSDGTKVWLNSGTTLRYPDKFGDKSRCVTITGEAFFKVAKMPDKPFTINSTDLSVQVLGTSFNFSAYQEDSFSSVTLVEGKVAIRDIKGIAIAQLHPGQMAMKEKSSDHLNINEVNTTSYSAWTEGKIFFDDERLDQIACKLERWFNVEISFVDNNLKSKRFTGTILKNKPVDQIMQALELLAPIKFRHQINANGKDKITIFKRT
ncbi:MAG: FecR domain-containing protein [Prolixibacteraceae bacterium]